MKKLSLKDRWCIKHVRKLCEKHPGMTLIVSISKDTGNVIGATLFCDEFDYIKYIERDTFIQSCNKIFVNVFPLGMRFEFIE